MEERGRVAVGGGRKSWRRKKGEEKSARGMAGGEKRRPRKE